MQSNVLSFFVYISFLSLSFHFHWFQLSPFIFVLIHIHFSLTFLFFLFLKFLICQIFLFMFSTISVKKNCASRTHLTRNHVLHSTLFTLLLKYKLNKLMYSNIRAYRAFMLCNMYTNKDTHLTLSANARFLFKHKL